MKFVARKEELLTLKTEFSKKESSFIAIYGRRRIGKTELINHFLSQQDGVLFSVTGAYDVGLKAHLANFSNKLALVFGCTEEKFTSWDKAFWALQNELRNSQLPEGGKISIFIDELPWLAEMKDNGFKGALSLFWNDFASKRDDIFLVVCGSATAWIIRHIIDDYGSLSNRITTQIHLDVFTLSESKIFLEQQGHKGLSHKTVVDYYMVLGGVAHYLTLLNKDLSFVQNINRLFFAKNGILRTEYNRLFRSLFKNHQVHEKIVDSLSIGWSGQSLAELGKRKGLTKGAALSNALKELEASNLLVKRYRYGQKKRDVLYSIRDPFIYFYNKWIKSVSQLDFISNPNYFLAVYKSQSYKSWCGFAFENIAHQHILAIKKALGIAGVITKNHYWRANNTVSKGAQIDILLERADDVINIIECKYHNTPFTINKRYAAELENKETIFIENTGFNGSVQIVMLSSAGLKENAYSQSILSRSLDLGIFFYT